MGPSCRHSPSDEWDYTSHSQNDRNSANHHPFPGHEPIMPGSDPNHLAHQQPHVVMRRAAGFRSQPPDHSPKSVSKSSGCRARQNIHSWPLIVAIMRAVGSRRRVGRSNSNRYTRNEVCTLKKSKVFGADVEATPSRSEAGVGSTGPPLPKLRRQMPSLLAESRHCHMGCKCACVSVGIRNSRVTGSASALTKLAHFSSGHRMNFRLLRCRFHNR